MINACLYQVINLYIDLVSIQTTYCVSAIPSVPTNKGGDSHKDQPCLFKTVYHTLIGVKIDREMLVGALTHDCMVRDTPQNGLCTRGYRYRGRTLSHFTEVQSNGCIYLITFVITNMMVF